MLHKAKQLEEYQNKSKLQGNQLIIKGRNNTTKTIHQLPDKLSGFHSTSKTNYTSIGFFGELKVFSIFHPAPFSLNGMTFHSSEQYIQYQKAKLFADSFNIDNILNSEDAAEAKRIARDIKGFDYRKWKDNAKNLCKTGILAKFLQNPRLMDKLVNMERKPL